jgi:hypothetical protein
MIKLKIAVAAAMALSAVAAIPATASADPHDRWERHRMHEGRWGHRHEGQWGYRHGGRHGRVCRDVRIGHHWEHRCHLGRRGW